MRVNRSECKPAPVRRSPGGELALIRRIAAQAGRQTARRGELQLGIGDDCAVLRPRPGEEIVVTTDFTLEGRHFRRDWHGAPSAGHRTLARGLSDLAAMGARPVAAFLSLALPQALAADRRWMDGYFAGLFTLADRVNVPLAGGDTAEAPGTALLADIVLLGAVKAGRALRRDGAAAGDRIYITGALGGSAAELKSFQSSPDLTTQRRRRATRVPADDAHPQLFPEPRLACGQALLRRGLATAAIDVSDGLSTDLQHLCEASHLSAEISAARLPLHSLLAALPADVALSLALHGGEDYELLFTAAAERRVPSTLGGVPVTEIGRLLPVRRSRPGIMLIDAAGHPEALQTRGWEHLR